MKLSLALLLLLPQAENPDLKYAKEHGLSIQKPPKVEEWGFRDQGWFKAACLTVAHKVDGLIVDVVSHVPPNANGWNVKAVADNAFTAITSNPGFTEGTRKALRQARLPGGGGGASAAQAWLLELTMKDPAGKLVEMSSWYFVARENGNLVQVSVVGEAGLYKKHQKMVDLILSTVRTWKIPK
ncbi:MAG TPA: hypothetical protein VEJ18_21765 [Planctomycetota bacterium]|nr:hypothetical protein [Planctomycetota bacterium]